MRPVDDPSARASFLRPWALDAPNLGSLSRSLPAFSSRPLGRPFFFMDPCPWRSVPFPAPLSPPRSCNPDRALQEPELSPSSRQSDERESGGRTKRPRPPYMWSRRFRTMIRGRRRASPCRSAAARTLLATLPSGIPGIGRHARSARRRRRPFQHPLSDRRRRPWGLESESSAAYT